MPAAKTLKYFKRWQTCVLVCVHAVMLSLVGSEILKLFKCYFQIILLFASVKCTHLMEYCFSSLSVILVLIVSCLVEKVLSTIPVVTVYGRLIFFGILVSLSVAYSFTSNTAKV